jgi:hypothetical protein
MSKRVGIELGGEAGTVWRADSRRACSPNYGTCTDSPSTTMCPY